MQGPLTWIEPETRPSDGAVPTHATEHGTAAGPGAQGASSPVPCCSPQVPSPPANSLRAALPRPLPFSHVPAPGAPAPRCAPGASRCHSTQCPTSRAETTSPPAGRNAPGGRPAPPCCPHARARRGTPPGGPPQQSLFKDELGERRGPRGRWAELGCGGPASEVPLAGQTAAKEAEGGRGCWLIVGLLHAGNNTPIRLSHIDVIVPDEETSPTNSPARQSQIEAMKQCAG